MPGGQDGGDASLAADKLAAQIAGAPDKVASFVDKLAGNEGGSAEGKGATAKAGSKSGSKGDKA